LSLLASLAALRARSPVTFSGMIAKIMKREISEAEQSRCARQRAMSIVEFCNRYGLGRTRAYEEMNSGRLRGRKIGTRTIITDDDAEDWLRNLPVAGAAR
jgi:hypothetical protein